MKQKRLTDIDKQVYDETIMKHRDFFGVHAQERNWNTSKSRGTIYPGFM